MQYQDAVAMEAAVLEKFDQGEDSVITGDRDYDNAALMEVAIKGNTSDIAAIHQQVEDVLSQLGSENITAEFGKYFPKYKDGDDDQTALIYDSAAKMGIVVAKNEQDIVTGDAATLAAANTHSDGNDAVTLAAANTHSDANDAVTLAAANDYTDEAIAAIDGIDGLQEIETEAVRNANRAGAEPGDAEAGVMRMEVVAELPDSPDEFTLYVVTG
jgi:hypothetical protein